jgi:superfamily II DNA helicase RecQ
MASKRAIDAVTNKLSLVLKEKQLEAILEFLSGKDVFVCLPTGYGKSLIYGILPLVYDELKGTVTWAGVVF